MSDGESVKTRFVMPGSMDDVAIDTWERGLHGKVMRAWDDADEGPGWVLFCRLDPNSFDDRLERQWFPGAPDKSAEAYAAARAWLAARIRERTDR